MKTIWDFGKTPWFMSLIILVVSLRCGVAHAAKVELLWTNPSTYTTGAAIPPNGLDHETAYWGTCSTGSNPTILKLLGTQQIKGTVPGAKMFAWVYPSGTGPFCFDLTTSTPAGAMSAPSNVVKWTPPTTLGPMQLGAVFHMTLRNPS